MLVSDLDLECQLWLKIRLAPMTPYFGTISLAFVGAPTIKVQLLPYNRVRLMRVPVVQVCHQILVSTCAVLCTCYSPVSIRTFSRTCKNWLIRNSVGLTCNHPSCYM